MSSPARPGLCYVVNSLNPGGTEKLVVEMSCAFSQEYSVEVICLDVPGTWASELRARGIPVRILWRQPGLDLSMPVQLGRHFRRHNARIVHAHQCTAWFYSALARLWSPGPRLLLEEHGRFYPEVENRARALVNRALIRKLTHRFVAVSRDTAARLQRYEGLDADQIEVIYNGVTPARLLTPDERAAMRAELGFADDDFVVGTVGRFDPIKNLPMLLASLDAAASAVAATRGLLVGDGPLFVQIQGALEGKGLEQRVRLTGYRSDARQLAQCLDLFVLASFSEGTSMALLEAMAAGIPVAVTEVGGNPEIVLNGETGWTVPSGSISEMTRVIIEAAQDPQKRQRLAVAGRHRFESHYSMSNMLDSYRELYQSLLSTGAQVAA
jgi:L-malate glycosyltransferase